MTRFYIYILGSVLYGDHNNCLYPLVIIKDSIMFAIYFPILIFFMGLALGKISVLSPFTGHPALNVFLWKIKGCMQHPVEQRDM